MTRDLALVLLFPALAIAGLLTGFLPLLLVALPLGAAAIKGGL